MPNEEVLGPRKTMFVLVIVVGCFAVLWPRILSPLILGYSQEQLKPNKFDRDAGCCEVMFGTELAVFELINEVCNSAIHTEGKLSPYAAAECRKAVNETCGLDIADFLKRSENVGKTSKLLVDTLKSSNSSCLKENFGVPVASFSTHMPMKSWTLQDTLKQERPTRTVGPHPALRERGRAIPAGVLPSKPVPMPAHMRPPPIPGMRPPLGSPGGPVPAPKSSMGFVMPIYTICIIIFFVYTLSKILFKRTGAPYEPVQPDPQFRRRVFRDDSRSSPDKLVVTAISGLVAEVQQQMEASYANNQQRQEAQDNNTRQYTNGTILHSTGPVHIVATEYKEPSKETSLESKVEKVSSIKDTIIEEESAIDTEAAVETEETATGTGKSALSEKDVVDDKEPGSEMVESKEVESKEISAENESKDTVEEKADVDSSEPTSETIEVIDSQDDVIEKLLEVENEEPKQEKTESVANGDVKNISNEPLTDKGLSTEDKEVATKATEEVNSEKDSSPEFEIVEQNKEDDLIKLSNDLEEKTDLKRDVENFIKEECKADENKEEKRSTPELLEEAIKEDSDGSRDEELDVDQENASVKVIGMEVTTHTADGGTWPKAEPTPTLPAPIIPLPAPQQKALHEADEVKSIFLETEIPQQSRVLIADYVEDKDEGPTATTRSPMVVSGKMTLSLIQDAARETPDREPESTVDEFTTASAVTQPAAEKQEDDSDEEIEEEIEIEEIEEEIEVEEIEEEEDDEPEREVKKTEIKKDAE
ncbi:hypothetical protein K1T71_010488 [Dendrolimus kikuchii]|uniref:Uncharacterized protein n=1 Tax=Dendrolimus kikuchii TaxID=765133 RepID=A0ACC1CSW9_9NEOP|nr:hypothetical protein K1T71_010488 [Dendrolimus kikuchii]